MRLESKNFIVRALQDQDRDFLRKLEYTRPWAKPMLDLCESIVISLDEQVESFDYFGSLWDQYKKSRYFWIIERKENVFLGDIQMDIDSEHEAHFYIQLLDDADVSGFGYELFDEVINYISTHSTIHNLYIELWNDKDRSRQIYEEAGYEMEDGYLEINL